MNTGVLPLLRCPFCAGTIRDLDVLAGSAENIQYGLLQCTRCRFEYPVIAGVTIMLGPDQFVDVKAETTARTVRPGPRVQHLVDLLKSGDLVRALSLLLGPASGDGNLFPDLAGLRNRSGAPPRLRMAHPELPGGRLPFPRGGRLLRVARSVYTRTVLSRAQLRLAEFLVNHGDELSALDVIDLYYRQYSAVETANYFAFRFGQPRDLAALSLASVLNHTTGPILDAACGVGHLTHRFTTAQPDRAVFGLDREFFHLFLASQFVAPGGNYICAPADVPLPFDEHSLSGIFCSDAFHYFLYRAGSVREFQRLLTDDGILILSRFGNTEVEPREGYELSVEGYGALFSDWPRIFMGEADLIDRYLHKRGPDLTVEAPPQKLREQKWLSVVASPTLANLRADQTFSEWPHALGRLQINPIYVAQRLDQNGDVELKFEFPSKWYAFENRQYAEYAAASAHLSKEVMSALRQGTRTAAQQEYVDRFVILGLPERY